MSFLLLVSKRVLVRNHSYENVFPLQLQINLFSLEKFCTKPLFETEAQSKLAWATDIFSVNDVELLFYPVPF